MILPMPSCLRTACPPDIMDNSLKSYTSSSIKCMTQHQFIPHLFLDVPGCCETLLDSNRSAHCRKLAKSTNCEIASNCDPSQGRSISLITRVNPFPGWGHAWTRKMTPSIPIFRNEINALAGRWRDRHVVGVYQCVWVASHSRRAFLHGDLGTSIFHVGNDRPASHPDRITTHARSAPGAQPAPGRSVGRSLCALYCASLSLNTNSASS